MIFLHLESFENKLSIRFLDIPTTVFLRSNLLRKVKIFCTVMIYFFLILASFHIQKNFWKYQTILSKKSNMSQQP